MKLQSLNTSRLYVAASLFAVGGLMSVRAQTYDQLAPKTPAVAAPAPALPPPALLGGTTPPNSEQLIGPPLKGLLFMADRAAVQATGFDAGGIAATGVPLLGTEEFRGGVQRCLGRPLTVALLNEITREVVLYFRRHDRPVVDVMVPEQSVASGTVQIVVSEGRLSRVRVEGSRWFATRLIAGSIRVQPGGEISSAALLEDLAWINQNPFRQADLVFARGENSGGTDIILRMQDRFPVRLYAGYEDSGNALTGYDRVLAGVNWGNAFGLDHQLNYQLTASPDFKKLVAHSGSYVIPVQRLRHTLTLFGSFADSRPELSGGFFALKGRTWQLGARYRVPLPALGKWSQDVTAGVDFKRSNNNLSFGGTQVFAQENDVVQAIAAYV
jgi:hemolysin activation/secretion protein